MQICRVRNTNRNRFLFVSSYQTQIEIVRQSDWHQFSKQPTWFHLQAYEQLEKSSNVQRHRYRFWKRSAIAASAWRMAEDDDLV